MTTFCVMYGYLGNDNLLVDKDSKNITFKDFKKERKVNREVKEDADKILLKHGFFGKPAPSSFQKRGVPYVQFYDTEVGLEGRSLEEVEEWIKISTKGTSQQKAENPIIIIK